MTRTASSLVAASLAAVLAASCGGSGKAPATVPAPAPTAPTTAESIIEGSIIAVGGRERLAKVQSIRQTGTFSLAQMGISGPVTVVAAPPRSVVTTIELKGFGKIIQGIHGDTAWEVTAVTGARLVTGKELAQQLREATFNALLIWKELYPKAELVGEVEFEGQRAHKVVLTAADGETQTRYFAKGTLLPIGGEMKMTTQMGDMDVTSVDSDWREVDGVKWAHKLLRRQGPQSFEILIDKIETNVSLDPATFALPPEVAALKPPAP